MELLPTQGQALRHYTASRPRPRRTRTQPPSSKPQELASEAENDTNSGMGRVDEGVEEFFTKKILPDYTPKGRWEESAPAQATASESGTTPTAPSPLLPPPPTSSSSSDNFTAPSVPASDSSSHVTPPLSSSSVTPTPDTTPSSLTPPNSAASTTTTTTPVTTALPPSKNIKKKFGDFFAFKRARAGRAAKAGGTEGGGGGERVKVTRTSIADLIRPLREAKERERERERERGTRSVEDANVSNGTAVTEGADTAAAGECLPGRGEQRDQTLAETPTTIMRPPPSSPPPSPPPAAGLAPTSDATPSIEGSAHSFATGVAVAAAAVVEHEEGTGGKVLERGERKKGEAGTADGERRLKITRRSLREGKSQSLILLSGLEPEHKGSMHSKKHSSESTTSFEQRLQMMLHRMGVAKTPPANTKTSQNKEDELRKANSEGAILDKPGAPPVFIKPRTMSTSSDTRRPMRAMDLLRTDPAPHPKPLLPEHPIGSLPPKPIIMAKPPIPVPAASQTPQLVAALCTAATGGAQPVHTPVRVEKEEEMDGSSRAQAQNQLQEEHSVWHSRQVDGPSVHGNVAPAMSPRRGPVAQDRYEKAQSVTDESLPKPRPRMKPLPQRRAMSVHEEALTMTQELKAVLQRSPVRHRGHLPTCTEDMATGEEAAKCRGRGGTEEEARRKGGAEEELDRRRRREESKKQSGTTGDLERIGNRQPLGEGPTWTPPDGRKGPSMAAPGHKGDPAPLQKAPCTSLRTATQGPCPTTERPPSETPESTNPVMAADQGTQQMGDLAGGFATAQKGSIATGPKD